MQEPVWNGFISQVGSSVWTRQNSNFTLLLNFRLEKIKKHLFNVRLNITKFINEKIVVNINLNWFLQQLKK